MPNKVLPIFNLSIADFDWQNNDHHFSNIPEKIHGWLYDTGSLTERAINYCQSLNSHFNVNLVKLETNYPDIAETDILQIDTKQKCLIREVLLNCDNNAIIFARTVIPQTTLTGKHEQLKDLGNKPLGEYLFNQDDMTRGALQISFYRDSQTDTNYWARRSLFYLNAKPLLVYEIFLQSM